MSLYGSTLHDIEKADIAIFFFCDKYWDMKKDISPDSCSVLFIYR